MFKRLVSFFVVATAIIIFIGYEFWLTVPDSRRQRVNLVHVETWGPQLRDVVAGRITAEQSLAIVLAMLALNATINIALAIPQSPSDVRDQVAIAVWRKWLEGVASLTAVTATVASIAAWLGPSVRTTSVVSALATVSAALCALLTVSIVQAVGNAAEREMDREEARSERTQLHARRHLLVSPRETGLGTSSPRQAIWVAAKAVLGQLALVAFFAALIATAAMLSVMKFRYGRDVVLTWGALRGLAYLWLVTAGITLVTCWLSFERWRTHRTKRPKLRLYALSWSLRIIYVVVVYSLFVLAPTGEDIVAYQLAIFVLYIALPIAVWSIVGWTRTHTQPKSLSWLASPLWRAVAVSLNRRDTVLESRIA
jgi:hypothetical protein